MDAEIVKQVTEILGVTFKEPKFLTEALTHRSFVNENRVEKVDHNERCEFLGDAVLELIISEYLFRTYNDRPEGELTSFRAATVRTESLAEVARELRFGEFLRMSKGEEATGGRDKDYLLANSFEAVLGAIYLDQGFAACQSFLERVIIPKIDNIVKYRLDIDSKTRFQEVAQSVYKQTPTYQLIKEEGPDHEKIFTMGAFIGDKNMGEGMGNSKQKAEEQAAFQALKKVEEMGPKELRLA